MSTHVKKLMSENMLRKAHERKVENYNVWKFQMTIMFRARKLIGIIDGTLQKEAHRDMNEWDDKVSICQSIIISAIDPKLMRKLMTCRTAH